MLDTVLAGADEILHDDDGVPMAWPVQIAGDKGYRAAWIDEYLLELGVVPVIPNKTNERNAPFWRQPPRLRPINS